LADIPTDFGTGEVYVPRNFDRRYHGPVRLRTSLASSLNVPAISLLELLGVRGFSAFLRDLGFDSIEGNDPSGYPDGGLGMALGNVPVTLYELVRAFSIFPRNGVYRDLAWRHACGLESECGPGVEPGYCAMSQSTAWIVFDMLSDPAERVTGFGMIDPFMIHTKAAVKTGTSSKNQHIWALAATKDYTVGVWLGNFAGQTVIGRTGSSVPAQVALEILSGIDGLQWQVAYDGGRPAPDAQGGHSAPVTGRAGGAGRPPDNSAAAPPSIEICSLSGMTAGPHCPATRREYIEGEAPPLCTFHVAAPSLLAAAVYPAEFASWIEGAHRNAAFYSATGQALEIPSPIEGAVYFYDRKLPPDVQAVRVEVLHRGGEKPVLSVNEKVAGGPYRSNGVLSLWIVPLVPGMMVIEARCGEDRVLRCVEVK
ncbi:MAG: hypothetical protein JW852_09925, partial [Spirochaetales bacterium]|nr:hypothetical protein [Spirochaetales bacterium]